VGDSWNIYLYECGCKQCLCYGYIVDDFHGVVFKIKHKLYIASWPAPLSRWKVLGSPKVNIYARVYRVNTTVLSDTYKCLIYMFRPLWPSSGWIQYQREKNYIIQYGTVQTLVWYEWGRDLVYKDMEGVCAEDVFGRSIRCHVSSVTLWCTSFLLHAWSIMLLPPFWFHIFSLPPCYRAPSVSSTLKARYSVSHWNKQNGMTISSWIFQFVF